MNKLITGLLLSLSVLLTLPTSMKIADKLIRGKATEVAVDKMYAETKVPKSEDALAPKSEFKFEEKNKIITLEDSNMVVFRGPVTESSVSEAIKKLQQKSRKLSESTPIYLVIDSPGGSISDGLDFIDFVNALPQKVHTITLFAASMAFQFVQNMDDRLIVRNGTLMSHRAAVGGLGGQIKGEFETRYKMIRRKVDYLDYTAAKRMSMPMADYEKMVVNEYWVHGFDAVADKAADQEVLLRCGKSLDATEDMKFDTFFGTIVATFSKCPLIKSPEKVTLEGAANETNKNYVQYVFNLAIEDKERFVKEYIITDKFYSVFK